jgi:hypothetical protein
MNGFAFALSFVLFVGGIALFGYAFEFPGWEAITFVGGLAAITVAIMIPVHVLKRTDR